MRKGNKNQYAQPSCDFKDEPKLGNDQLKTLDGKLIFFYLGASRAETCNLKAAFFVIQPATERRNHDHGRHQPIVASATEEAQKTQSPFLSQFYARCRSAFVQGIQRHQRGGVVAFIWIDACGPYVLPERALH